MRFHSTRDPETHCSLTEALCAGIAPDGGLFVPESFPRFQPGDLDGCDSLASVADRLLQPFFDGESLAAELSGICERALDFPVPLKAYGDSGLSVLELFHGPTAAFKDVGARFLAQCLSRLPEAQRCGLTILVATSGDTGGAVAAAFEKVPEIGVAVLYPNGMVSPRQEHQLTCWPEHIASFRIDGAFDDCQALVKAAFADAELKSALSLTSANSISIGRLLPQSTYYALASLKVWRDSGKPANFIIPTGNLGNALACIWARQMGLPIDQVVFATNANRAISDYLSDGLWSPGDTVATLASAMDVGNPSNMERLRHLIPSAEELARHVRAYSVNDDHIREAIEFAWREFGEPICPHTATAVQAWRWLQEAGDAHDWIVVSTAHPAKFESTVEPVIGETVAIPPALADLLQRESRWTALGVSLDELREALIHQFSHR